MWKAFNVRMEEQLKKEWPTCTGVVQKWEALVEATRKVATQVLLVKGKRSADCIQENEGRIRHTTEKWNLLWWPWLSSGVDVDRGEYIKQRSEVQ